MKTMVLVMYQNFVILELMIMTVQVVQVVHIIKKRILVFVKHLGMELVHTAIVEINVVARVAIQDQQHGAKSQIQVVTKVVWSL